MSGGIDYSGIPANRQAPPKPNAGDVEGLAKALHDHGLCVEIDGHRQARACERFARAALGNWLAVHDAGVRRAAGERIAQAIEETPIHERFLVSDHAYQHAARIAREVTQ